MLIPFNWDRDFISTAIGGLILGAIVFVLVWRWEKKYGRRIDNLPGKREYVKEYFKGLLLVSVMCGLARTMIAAGPHVVSVIDSLLRHVCMGITQVLIACTVLLLGGIFFLFKMGNLLWYGRIEVTLAAAVALVTARQFSTGAHWLTIFGTLGGCVYVVTRGPSNSHAAKMRALRQRNETILKQRL